MKIIRNNFIPFSGYKAMNLFGVLFVRGNAMWTYNASALRIYNSSNVIVRNCKFVNLHGQRSIDIRESTNVLVYNCDFISCWAGAHATLCTGGIRIFSNDFYNNKGTLVNPESQGGPCQLVGCSGSNNRVQDNVSECELNVSRTIDHIATYQCHFDALDPYIVRNNWIRGGGYDHTGDTDNSSGGIIIGDVGGSNNIMEYNVLVDPGQYGIGLAGGANQTMRGNKVYGSQRAWSNVGLIAANWTPEVTPTENWYVGDNKINWVNKDGDAAPYWVWEGDAPYIQGWNTNSFQDPSINSGILPVQIIGV